jgi:quinoprotein dehydrogenase-associated probable ABC transporter substrate-binding protein
MFSVFKLFGGLLVLSGLLFSAAAPLRVCADPNNLPYSNKQEQGFENKLAGMFAKDFGTRVVYTWYPQRGNFFKKTLGAGVCDVVMGVPAGFREADETRPYYRSSYVFVSRRDRSLHIRSFDDPRLRNFRIGVHVLGDSDRSLPPVRALLNRGIVRNLVAFNIFGSLGETNPSADLIEAVVHKRVDIAVAWGPLAEYFGKRSAVPLDVTPIAADASDANLPLSFEIAIGVRHGAHSLKQKLDAELERRQPEIRALLLSYGIPQWRGAASPSQGE